MFGGFFTEPYGKGERYISSTGNGEKFLTEDKTLYSLWTYSITYANTENYTNINPVSYTGEYDVELHPLIVKKGYKFNGWLDENGKPVTKILSGSSGKRTFTSTGTSIQEFKITYNKNGGIWDDTPGDEYIPPEQYNMDSGVILLPRSSDIKKEGFTFDGWYKDKDFTGSAVLTIESESYADIELWAKWIENE